MGGGYAQLAAYGTADQFLSFKPSITYFKQIWRRYSSFSLENVLQSWMGDEDFGKKCSITLSKAGDLVTEVWLQITLPDLQDLNHLGGVTPSAAAPVISYARATTQDGARVTAYTCDDVASYLLHMSHQPASLVTGVELSAANVLSVLLTGSPTTPRLVPFGGQLTAATNLVLSNGKYVSSGPLVADTPYALCYGTDTAARTDVFMLKAGVVASNVSFVIPSGLDPVLTYTAKVRALLSSNAVVSSSDATVLKVKWCNSVGHAFVQSVEWEIGGSRIDRHTGEHYDMLCELTETAEKRDGYSEMIGRYDDYDINYDSKSSGGRRTLFVPLRFSFNTNPGNALPIVALQFHDCRLNFEFRPFMELIKSNVAATFATEPALPECKVYATYVFLSEDERNRFASMPHEYLIEQLQMQVESVAGAGALESVVNRKIKMPLMHPVKELFFVYHAAQNITKNTVTGNNWFQYDIPGREGEEIFDLANIQMNGSDRFVKMPALWWRSVNPWSYHTRIPRKKVHNYLFSIYPEEKNPAGAANFSRIDVSHLALELNPNLPAGRIRIHAVSYNILRIAEGLGGLRFAA
jgi:hypothetical protein